MGYGNWFFPVVRRDGRYRRLACVHSVASGALAARNWRIGRVSLLCEGAGTACSGSWPGIRKRAHRRRSRMRPGLGHIFWRDAHGTIWMAPLLHRTRNVQYGLADSVVRVGASGRLECFVRRGKQRGASQTLDGAIDVGDVRWSVWGKLRALFRNYLAAVLSGARASSFDGNDGKDWHRRIFMLLGWRCALRLDFRPVDRRWRKAYAGSQDLRWSGSGERGAAPAWLRPRGSNGFGDSVASGVRSRRYVRVQYLGDHANTGRAKNGGPLDRFPKFRRESCGRHCASLNRICR